MGEVAGIPTFSEPLPKLRSVCPFHVFNMVRILAFGDSLTEGWTAFGTKFHPYSSKLQILLQSLPVSKPFSIINRGISGETTEQMQARLPRILAKDGPFDLAIILGGTNDLGRSLDKKANSLFERLKSLHEEILKECPLSVALTIPEGGFDERNPALRKKRSKVNQLLKDYVQANRDKMILCDLSVKLPHKSLSEEDRRRFWHDGLHFTPDGYDRMAEVIFEDIKQYFVNFDES